MLLNKRFTCQNAIRALCLLLVCTSALAQKKQKDTSNFVFYPEKIMIRANLSTQSDAYVSIDKNNDNLNLMTNNNYKLFLAFDYKFIGFTYGFYPNFFGGNNDDDRKGKSKFSEYNFRFFLGKWVQTAEYSKIKGYYVENTADFVPDWDAANDQYLLFPNFETLKYGMSTSYIFNPKFSIKSITSFTEWQKESAGSFIPTFIYGYKKMSFDTDEIKVTQNEFDLNLGAGYFYNLIIHKKFYIAPHLTAGVGVKFTDLEEVDGGIINKEKKNYFAIDLVGGIKVGYNSDRILFGASFNFDSNSYSADKNQVVSNNKEYGLLYFGYRFDAPNFIKKPVGKIDDKLKF